MIATFQFSSLFEKVDLSDTNGEYQKLIIKRSHHIFILLKSSTEQQLVSKLKKESRSMSDIFFISTLMFDQISLSGYPEFKRHNPRCNFHPSEMSIITLQIFNFIYFSKT